MLIAACQTAPNAKHGWFPVLKPVFSLVFLKKSCWSQLATPLRMWSIARFLFWNLHFPYCFWRNHADRSLPNRSECEAWLVSCVEASIFPSVFLRNHADRSLPSRPECKAWLVSCFETCRFPSAFEEIMLIAACQTAPNVKHGSFPVLIPAISVVFLKNSCWSQLAKPLRMRSIARSLFWNLHFP